MCYASVLCRCLCACCFAPSSWGPPCHSVPCFAAILIGVKLVLGTAAAAVASLRVIQVRVQNLNDKAPRLRAAGELRPLPLQTLKQPFKLKC